MNPEDIKGGKPKVGKMVLKGIVRALLANPPVLALIIVVIGGLIAYTVYSIDYQLKQIMVLYQSLSAKRTDSKSGFDKKLFYITIDENGNQVIHVGYSSEEAEQQAQADLEESGAIDNSTPVVISGDGAQLVNTIKASNYNLNTRFSPYAEQYGYVYDKIIEAGYPPEFALGVVANITSEGTAGMRQSTYQLITKNELETIVANATQAHSNSIGVGLMQWTFWSFMPELLSRYNNGNVWNSDGTIDPNKALIVETEWILEKCNSEYRTACARGCSSAEWFAEDWCDYMERPGAYCGDGNQMGYVNGRSSHGTACQTRVDRATKLVNGMR